MLISSLRFIFITLFPLFLIACATQPPRPHVGCWVADDALRGRYEGQCNAQRQAHGTGKSVGEDTYEGTFSNGIKHGRGIYTWQDGARYVGEFRNGLAHGSGVFINREGKRYEGKWDNNEIVR